MDNKKNFLPERFNNMDLNEINYKTNEKPVLNEGQSLPENDNISEKANSVQTSYQYKKNKRRANSTYSRGSSYNQEYYQSQIQKKQYDDQISLSISDNDNLICTNCINSVLIEEKQKRNEYEKNYYNNNNSNSNGFFTDGLINNDQNIIDKKRRLRELNTNEAYQNLAKINAGLNSKDRLIQINENSRNPLNDGLPDYQYKKFQDEYQRRQKMINDNIDKFYPKSGNERAEIASYYDNYVNNPKYNTDNNYESFNNRYNNMTGEYVPKNRYNQEYLKSLEDQIYHKMELKKREEEEKRKEKEQYDNYQKELKREEEERYLREKKKKEELMKANKELIEQKNKQKMKELQDNLKYKELYEKQNEEYQKELKSKELENERRKKDFYNDNKNEYENRKKMKEKEKYNERNNKLGDFGKLGKLDKKDQEFQDKQAYDKNRKNIKEKMGRCCRCHRIFPRRLLTINRYFYRENRK